MKYAFVNGVFDILHRGHLQLLNYASTLGPVIVAINSDESVMRLKGPHRPINTAEDRKDILKALRCVYEVFVFSDSTPIQILSHLHTAKADIGWIVKGYEYVDKAIPEKAIIEKLFPDAVFRFVGMSSHSTTDIIRRMKQ